MRGLLTYFVSSGGIDISRERFATASDIDLLPIGTTPWAMVDLAQRERPNVILIDFEGMTVADVASATVELSEILPSAALVVLEPQDITGTAHALGATESQWLWSLGLTPPQLAKAESLHVNLVETLILSAIVPTVHRLTAAEMIEGKTRSSSPP